MKRFLIATLSLSLCLPAIAGKRKPPPPPPPCVSLLDASCWTFRFGTFVDGFDGGHPSPLGTQPGWFFDFPVLQGPISKCWPGPTACPQVDYVLADYRQDITQFSRLVITAQVLITSGAPVFNYQMEEGNTSPYPAHASAMIWSCEESCGPTLIGLAEYGRWWSDPVALDLTAAAYGGVPVTFSVPIAPDQWTSLHGERGNNSAAAMSGWYATLSAPGKVALTFGGGNSKGHGVNVSNGTAQFIVTNFHFE